MGRGAVTMVGIAILLIAAVLIGKTWLQPAEEQVERKEPVLTGEYDQRLLECGFLNDGELPGGLEPPGVGEDLLYLLVTVLQPGLDTVDAADEYFLDDVNGIRGVQMRPAHVGTVLDEEGVLVHLTFKTDHSFVTAHLVHKGKVVLRNVGVE